MKPTTLNYEDVCRAMRPLIKQYLRNIRLERRISQGSAACDRPRNPIGSYFK
jgi:hypothetical protein